LFLAGTLVCPGVANFARVSASLSPPLAGNRARSACKRPAPKQAKPSANNKFLLHLMCTFYFTKNESGNFCSECRAFASAKVRPEREN